MSNLWTDIKTGAYNVESDFERGLKKIALSKNLSDIGKQFESGAKNVIKEIPGGNKVVKGSGLLESDVKNLLNGGLSDLSKQLDSGLKQIWNNVKNEMDDLKDHISTNQNNITSPAATVAPTTMPTATVAATTMPAATVAPTTMPAATVAPTTMPAATVAASTMPDDSNYDLSSTSASVIPVIHSDEQKTHLELPTVVSEDCSNCTVPVTSSPGIITSFADVIKSHEGLIVITIVVVLLLLFLIHIR